MDVSIISNGNKDERDQHVIISALTDRIKVLEESLEESNKKLSRYIEKNKKEGEINDSLFNRASLFVQPKYNQLLGAYEMLERKLSEKEKALSKKCNEEYLSTSLKEELKDLKASKEELELLISKKNNEIEYMKQENEKLNRKLKKNENYLRDMTRRKVKNALSRYMMSSMRDKLVWAIRTWKEMVHISNIDAQKKLLISSINDQTLQRVKAALSRYMMSSMRDKLLSAFRTWKDSYIISLYESHKLSSDSQIFNLENKYKVEIENLTYLLSQSVESSDKKLTELKHSYKNKFKETLVNHREDFEIKLSEANNHIISLQRQVSKLIDSNTDLESKIECLERELNEKNVEYFDSIVNERQKIENFIDEFKSRSYSPLNMKTKNELIRIATPSSKYKSRKDIDNEFMQSMRSHKYIPTKKFVNNKNLFAADEDIMYNK